jgi:hypothetical protein
VRVVGRQQEPLDAAAGELVAQAAGDPPAEAEAAAGAVDIDVGKSRWPV